MLWRLEGRGALQAPALRGGFRGGTDLVAGPWVALRGSSFPEAMGPKLSCRVLVRVGE